MADGVDVRRNVELRLLLVEDHVLHAAEALFAGGDRAVGDPGPSQPQLPLDPGLAGYEDVLCGRLSAGQHRRVALARLLALEPEVLLLDEPCSALDPIATAHIEELLLELKKDVTIVIVTHNMQQAARVSDFTAFFSLDEGTRSGVLIEYDDTQKIFTNPDKSLTEDYITGRFG